MTTIFIGAGEASSDKIGYQIVKNLPTDTQVFGVTGSEMSNAGVRSLFDISEISFIGLDILYNIRSILKRINQVADWICTNNPEVAIFVDAYDFYIRVAELVKKRGCKTKIVAVVAPLAWMYSKGKVKQMKKYFDELICIFPFEPDFFKSCGYLNAYFFGNPFLQQIEDKILLRDNDLILVTIGSRNNEIKRHLFLMMEVIKKIKSEQPSKKFFIPTTATAHKKISEYFADYSYIECSCDEDLKDLKMRTASFAIAKSGTNTTEIAARGLPMIVYYKIGILSYLVGRFLLKIRMINMVNIVANKMIIPEVVQIVSNADKIVNLYKNIDAKGIQEQSIGVAKSISLMRGDLEFSFGKKVADFIINLG